MKIKQLFFLIIAIFAVMPVLAMQDTSVIDGTVDTNMPFIKMFFGFVVATFSGLLINASKWMRAGLWNWKAFFDDILMPWLFSIIGGGALIALQVYAPQYEFLISPLANGEISLNYQALFVTGGFLAFAIKKIIFRKKAPKK